MSGSIQQEAALLIALVFRVANGQVLAGERPCENSLRARRRLFLPRASLDAIDDAPP